MNVFILINLLNSYVCGIRLHVCKGTKCIYVAVYRRITINMLLSSISIIIIVMIFKFVIVVNEITNARVFVLEPSSGGNGVQRLECMIGLSNVVEQEVVVAVFSKNSTKLLPCV